MGAVPLAWQQVGCLEAQAFRAAPLALTPAPRPLPVPAVRLGWRRAVLQAGHLGRSLVSIQAQHPQVLGPAVLLGWQQAVLRVVRQAAPLASFQAPRPVPGPAVQLGWRQAALRVGHLGRPLAWQQVAARAA